MKLIRNRDVLPTCLMRAQPDYLIGRLPIFVPFLFCLANCNQLFLFFFSCHSVASIISQIRCSVFCVARGVFYVHLSGCAHFSFISLWQSKESVKQIIIILIMTAKKKMMNPFLHSSFLNKLRNSSIKKSLFHELRPDKLSFQTNEWLLSLSFLIARLFESTIWANKWFIERQDSSNKSTLCFFFESRRHVKLALTLHDVDDRPKQSKQLNSRTSRQRRQVSLSVIFQWDVNITK